MTYTKALFLVLLAATSIHLSGQKELYTKAEIIADLEFLKQELESTHPNLYAYSSEEEVEHWFKRKSDSLPTTTDERTAFSIISSISSLLKDGHSYIYPSAKHLDDFFNSAPLFPLDVFLRNGKLIVVANHSREQNIPLGATLLTINGETVKKIQSAIVPHISRDGNNLEYPKHLFFQFLPAYHSFAYGFQDSFDISYAGENGKPVSAIIQGLTRAEISTKRKSETGTGISLRILPNKKAAVLRVKSFDNKMLKGDYSQKFKKEIKKAFEVLENKGIQHLAIDLRDNQGGELSNGAFLLKRFMNTPFQCVSSYTVLKKGGRKTLSNKWDDFFKPVSSNHFKGDVYLFTNGGSFSCSSIVANTFKSEARGKILGQMTGGSAYLLTGGPNDVITLPNTQVLFTIPKTQYVLRKDITNIGQGVLPDIELEDGPGRLIGDEDKLLNKFIELAEE
jgi:hypothetical protein